MPSWIVRRGSMTPSSTARRNIVPWKYFEPKYWSQQSVWLSKWTSPTGPWRRDRTQDGQRDRMVAAHADGDDVGVEELANFLLDDLEGALDGNGHDVDVAVVGDAQPFEGRDALGMTVGANHGGLGADLAGAEARAGAVGGAAVERDAEQRHFEGTQLTAVGQAHEGGDPAEAGRDKGVGRPELAHHPFPPRRLNVVVGSIMPRRPYHREDSPFISSLPTATITPVGRRKESG